jgi:AcrR family transcriptional regulator
MTPRPRKASDDDIFAAAQRAMMRLGPNELTLNEIASEAGLTAGALVQRFGSKRELMLALMERWSGGAHEMFDGLRAATPSPLGAIRYWAECMASMGDSPEGLAHHLGWLQLDLGDPDFHRFAQRNARESREEMRRLVQDAIEAGELPGEADPAEAARVIETTVSGSLMTWGFHREGTAKAWVAEDLERVLGLLTQAANA